MPLQICGTNLTELARIYQCDTAITVYGHVQFPCATEASMTESPCRPEKSQEIPKRQHLPQHNISMTCSIPSSQELNLTVGKVLVSENTACSMLQDRLLKHPSLERQCNVFMQKLWTEFSAGHIPADFELNTSLGFVIHKQLTGEKG